MRRATLFQSEFFRRYMRCIKVCIAVISGILIGYPGLTLAEDAKLSNLIVTNTHHDLLIYATVEGAFHEKMIQAIESGVPTTFSFFIMLYQSRSIWFDKKLADIEVSHTIRYNSLKKEYLVERSWENAPPRSVKSLDEARRLMTDIDGLRILSLSMLEKGRQYQVLVRARLSKVILPYHLHYVLFFMSLWDFETDWYSVDFVY
ncbi:MAG: DUF4390 domain-containing protein [Desulfatirhabdiaceae bacterium]